MVLARVMVSACVMVLTRVIVLTRVRGGGFPKRFQYYIICLILPDGQYLGSILHDSIQ